VGGLAIFARRPVCKVQSKVV